MPDTATDTPIATAIERTTMSHPAPFGNDFIEAAQPPRPVEDAFAFTNNRLDRLEHMLDSLQGTIQRLANRLTPVLTGGTYGRPEAPGDTINAETTPEDRRSTIARRIAGNGQRADYLADLVVRLERDLEDLTDALEV